ncbi:folate-binding protein YgfZ [Acetobacteraceae bacterium H6797]|nr:folate-binding protein YgfZ [Acetobacteraceae bacterium H6797]
MPIAILPDRGIVEISGEDRFTFLQGLVSQDVTQARPDHLVWAALLTPQGKWLADFFIHARPAHGVLLLETEAGAAPLLVKTLSRFRLRAKVALKDVSAEWTVLVGWKTPAPLDAAPDPRLPEAGWRAILPPHEAMAMQTATALEYDRHRLSLGLPDGGRDLDAEKSVLLEAGFDELNGIAWTKGCYMGQELTARTKYRGLLKKRLVPVSFEGADIPPRGTPIMLGEREVGEMRSGQTGLGLALLRLEALASGEPMRAGDVALHPHVPGWMKLPEPKAEG